jgi:hypothetical protein
VLDGGTAKKQVPPPCNRESGRRGRDDTYRYRARNGMTPSWIRTEAHLNSRDNTYRARNGMTPRVGGQRFHKMPLAMVDLHRSASRWLG